jgi:hypothetical protein
LGRIPEEKNPPGRYRQNENEDVKMYLNEI